MEKPLDEAEGNREITDQIANQALASKVTVGFIVVWTHDGTQSHWARGGALMPETIPMSGF